MKRSYCDDDQTKILGVCWDDCPEGWRDDGLLCNDRSGLTNTIINSVDNTLTTNTGLSCDPTLTPYEKGEWYDNRGEKRNY